MKIKAKNIVFRFINDVPLLEDVDFEIPSASFTFIIGLNGTGKSTLLRILSSNLKPLQGDIFLSNKNIEDITQKEIAKTIAFVPQSFTTVFPISVFDFVATGRTPYLNFYGTLRKEDEEIIRYNLELLKIEKICRKSITEISGGEFRRVQIARALCQEPKILLLDEPSAFLDIEHQISIFEFLEFLNKEKEITIVAVSHDLNLTGMFATDIILLESHKTIQLTKDEILNPTKIKEHFGVEAFIRKQNDFLNVTITR